MEATKEATKLVSTTYEIRVKWYKQRRIGTDGRYSYKCLCPGEHFLHEKHNLRVDCLMPEEGKLVCEVSYGDREKRKPVFWKLMGDEWVVGRLPFRVPNGAAFRIRGWVYRVEFLKTVRRLQVISSWAIKGMVPEGMVPLVYPSGHLVVRERSGGEELQAYAWQEVSALLVGMEVSGFEPPARIVRVDVEGNKAVISPDPSHWVA